MHLLLKACYSLSVLGFLELKQYDSPFFFFPFVVWWLCSDIHLVVKLPNQWKMCRAPVIFGVQFLADGVTKVSKEV